MGKDEIQRELHEIDPVREPTKLTEATKELARKHRRGDAWRRTFYFLDLGDVDSLKRTLGVERAHYSRLGAWFGMSSPLFFVIGHEVFHKYVRPDVGICAPYSGADNSGALAVAVIAQCLVTITSVLLAWSVYKFHVVQFSLATLEKEVSPLASFWSTTFGRQTVIEIIVSLLHIPPGVYQCFETRVEYVTDDFVAVYPLDVLNVFLAIRVYLLARYISYNNRFSTQRAATVLKLYSQKNSPLLAFKDMLQNGSKGVTIFGLGYFMGLFVFAYVIMLFEREGGHLERGDGFAPSFQVCLWMCWTVMTTIGFGDWVAVTPLGRFFVVVLGAYGTIISAFIVSYAYSLLDLSSAERKVCLSLDCLDCRVRLKSLAATLIQRWWATKKRGGGLHKKTKMERLVEALAAWRNVTKQLNELKDPEADIMDIHNQVGEVRLTLAEVGEIIATTNNRTLASLTSVRRGGSNRSPLTPKASSGDFNLDGNGAKKTPPPAANTSTAMDPKLRHELAEIRAMLSTLLTRTAPSSLQSARFASSREPSQFASKMASQAGGSSFLPTDNGFFKSVVTRISPEPPPQPSEAIRNDDSIFLRTAALRGEARKSSTQAAATSDLVWGSSS